MDFQNELKLAMLGKDLVATRTLRMLITAIKNEEIQKGRSLDQDETIIVIKRLVKQRQDSAEQYHLGGREELKEQELLEINVLSGYLPAILEGEELGIVITGIIGELGSEAVTALGKKITGVVMKTLRERYGVAFDGQQASKLCSTI